LFSALRHNRVPAASAGSSAVQREGEAPSDGWRPSRWTHSPDRRRLERLGFAWRENLMRVALARPPALADGGGRASRSLIDTPRCGRCGDKRYRRWPSTWEEAGGNPGSRRLAGYPGKGKAQGSIRHYLALTAPCGARDSRKGQSPEVEVGRSGWRVRPKE